MWYNSLRKYRISRRKNNALATKQLREMWFFQIVLNRLGRIWRTIQSENLENMNREG